MANGIDHNMAIGLGTRLHKQLWTYNTTQTTNVQISVCIECKLSLLVKVTEIFRIGLTRELDLGYKKKSSVTHHLTYGNIFSYSWTQF